MNDVETIKQHPELFGEAPFDPKETLIGFGFECSDGWYNILEDLFNEISQYIKDNNITDFKIVQVKEKFGTLTVYTHPHIKEIQTMISKAEARSARTCEVCGKPGVLQTKGWFKVRCEEHYDA